MLNTFKGHENRIETLIFAKTQTTIQNIFYSDYVEYFNKSMNSGGKYKSPESENNDTNNTDNKDNDAESNGHTNANNTLEDLNKKLLEKSELIKKNIQQGNSAQKINKEYLISAGRDKTIKIWDVYANTCVHSLIGHDNWVRSIILHPNGKYLISSSDDKSIRIWELKNGRCVRKMLDVHDRLVYSLAINQKYPLMASGSLDQLIKLWDCK